MRFAIVNDWLGFSWDPLVRNSTHIYCFGLYVFVYVNAVDCAICMFNELQNLNKSDEGNKVLWNVNSIISVRTLIFLQLVCINYNPPSCLTIWFNKCDKLAPCQIGALQETQMITIFHRFLISLLSFKLFFGRTGISL